MLDIRTLEPAKYFVQCGCTVMSVFVRNTAEWIMYTEYSPVSTNAVNFLVRSECDTVCHYLINILK